MTIYSLDVLLFLFGTSPFWICYTSYLSGFATTIWLQSSWCWWESNLPAFDFYVLSFSNSQNCFLSCKSSKTRFHYLTILESHLQRGLSWIHNVLPGGPGTFYSCFFFLSFFFFFLKKQSLMHHRHPTVINSSDNEIAKANKNSSLHSVYSSFPLYLIK